jgi:Uma2 family endonuclease
MQSVVVLGRPPAELEDLIERRRRSGQDLHDEVWEGTYHMAPAPHADHGYLDAELARVLQPLAEAAGLVPSGPLNIGDGREDYRVPDRALLRRQVRAVFVPTAAVVVEIVSPDDETYGKLPFYAAHDVDEVIVVEGRDMSVRIFRLIGDGYEETGRSVLLGVDGAELAAFITWPQ